MLLKSLTPDALGGRVKSVQLLGLKSLEESPFNAGPNGLTVNSVAPGYVATEMVAAVPKEALDKVIAKIPVGRLGDADEIARVVEFLADPDSAFITGQIYSVNGGQYM